MNRHGATWPSYGSEDQQAREAGNQQAQIPTTPFERLARRADNMSKMSAALKHVADAGAPLYQALNEAQKNRFTKLARFLRPYHNMHVFNAGGGGWREEHQTSKGTN